MRAYAFAAWMIQAVVLAAAIVPPACASACDDDGDDDCSPRCPTCSCGHAQKPLLLSATFLFAPRADDVTRARSLGALDPPADPEPRGIFHPPRA